MVGVSGGGAFLIPYLVGILMCGLPIFMLELAGGRHYRGGVLATFGGVQGSVRWVGALVALWSLVLLSYYLVVAGWALGYWVSSPTGSLSAFATFTSGFNSVWFFLIFLAICGSVVLLGVKHGIEAVSRLLMPLLFLMLIGLAVYGVSLAGWSAGMRFYLTPHLSSLADPLVWISAFGQVFFSIGVGTGVMITYGSYLGSGDNIASSSVVTTVADILAAFIAGLVIFPIVFSFGGEPAAGPQLAFDTLPKVFRQFPGITGAALATSFYLLLMIGALTSAVSLLETVLVALMEATGMGRRGSLALLLGILMLLGLPSALSYSAMELKLFGSPVLDSLDSFTGNVLLPLGVLATAIVLGWLTPRQRMVQEVRPGFIGWSCLLLVRFAVPAAIVALLMTTIVQRLGSP